MSEHDLTVPKDEFLSKSDVLYVQLLGDFVLQYNGKVLSREHVQIQQLWDLLEYVVINRNKEISTGKLIEALWGEDQLEDPSNTLKNLAYRLRGSIQKNLVLPCNYIVNRHGVYAWDIEAPCVFDVDIFEGYYKQAMREDIAKEEKIKFFSKAVALYKGNFLSKSPHREWVMPFEAYYQRMYMEMVQQLCKQLMESEQYEEAEWICRKAILINPHVEKNHKILMRVLSKENQPQKALEHYNDVSELFRDRLGIKPAQEIGDIYKEMMQRELAFEKHISNIEQDLLEKERIEGAFVCNYDVFKMIYRMLKRTLYRSNSNFYMVLLTVETMSIAVEITLEDWEHISACICHSLRRVDIVSRFSKNQFLMLLADLSEDNVNRIVNRVKRSLEQEWKTSGIEFSTQCKALSAGEDLDEV